VSEQAASSNCRLTRYRERPTKKLVKEIVEHMVLAELARCYLLKAAT
jgi:hypothetical protein